MPGLETRMALLMSEGVMKNRIDINQFVSLTSTAPAKLYGLYPRKGSIAPGCDADIVIWDTDLDLTLTNSMLHHNVDYTPYEGKKISVWPNVVFARGEVVVKEGECVASPGRGEFLPSAPYVNIE